MVEQNPDLIPLREQVETKVRRHLSKMYSGERAELTFDQDFHGDQLMVTVIKSSRVDEVAVFKANFRNWEVSRRDGFNYKRDLTWTIDKVLIDLGL